MLSLWRCLCNINKIAVTHTDNYTHTKETTHRVVQLSQLNGDTNDTCPTEAHIPTNTPIG